MQKLSNLIDELASYIPQLEARNEAVSASSVGWQIEHSLLVISSVIDGVQRSDPSKYKWSFRPIKYLIFWRGKIPRGKAKAPKVVIPTQVATQEELFAKLAAAKNNVLKLDSFSENQFFNHPYFKDLNVKQTKKFLMIHTKHHLKIIEDILK